MKGLTLLKDSAEFTHLVEMLSFTQSTGSGLKNVSLIICFLCAHSYMCGCS